MSRWFADYDATNNRVSCPQTDPRFPPPANLREDEDCLYLNVFMPAVSEEACAHVTSD